MSRVPLPDNASAGPELGPILERVEQSMRGVPNLYRALGNAPRLLDAWIDYAWTLRSDADVDRGLRELAILRVAQLSNADYVWRSHWAAARAGGNTEEQLRALSEWPDSTEYSDAQRAVLAVADQLTRGADLDDQAWDELQRFFDVQASVELLLTIAWYACVARMTNGLRIPVEDANLRNPGWLAR